MTMTRTRECSATPVLMMSLELSEKKWKVGFQVGMGTRPHLRSVAARGLDVLVDEIAKAKQRWQLPADVPVVSCYEAGRDGFWLHRWLVAQGVTNYVVDAASIAVDRRAKRTKTDPLDVAGLLSVLARYLAGDRCVRVVRVPTVAQEDARHWHRSRDTWQRERTRVINRIKSLLATLGTRLPVSGDFPTRVAAARLWDGTPLPPAAQQRLRLEWALLQHVDGQLQALQAQQRTLALEPAAAAARAKLEGLRAIGPIGAQVLATEIFGWREIRRARQLGGLVGLVPGRYQSGETQRDLGITRAGNALVRHISVQLAWAWVRHQPDSALTRWYQRRFGGGGPRQRRIGIVAVARKLLVALWRYVDHDLVPEGAQLKTAIA